jgi:3-deoxy-D-manno-octulosonic-acid transferase
MSTLALRIYSGLTTLAAPFLARQTRAKLTSQGVSEARSRERLGQPTQPRPPGTLVWIHAASVGESLSALPLIDALLAARPDLEFLITTGTATSARILEQRMPPRTRHQFAPIDSKRALTAFLNHWKPDLLVLVESEIWPQMIRLTAARGTPLALVNARFQQVPCATGPGFAPPRRASCRTSN